MKINKHLVVNISLIFLVILFTNYALADVSVEIQKKNPDGSLVTIDNLNPLTKANINSITNYAKASYPDGKITVDFYEEVTIRNNGKTILTIPRGLKLEYKNNKLYINGKPELIYSPPDTFGKVESYYPSVVVHGFNVDIPEKQKSKNIQIEFEEVKEVQKLHISDYDGFRGININKYKADGTGWEFQLTNIRDGNIEIDKRTKKIGWIGAVFGDYGGDVDLNSNGDGSNRANYKGLKEIGLRFNEKQEIDYADLTSQEGGSYSFRYKGKDFIFTAQKNGHITFDPLEEKLSGENAGLQIGDKIIDSFKGFSIEIDENGNLKSINLKEGGWYYENTGKKYSATKGDLKLFFNGEGVKDLEGNYVSFGNNGLVKLKGLVKISGGLGYEGKSANTYTEFDPYYRKPDGTNIQFFDVKQGDAILTNQKNTIIIENGKAKLVLNEGPFRDKDIGAISFGFAVYDNNQKVLGYLDEKNSDYSLIAYRENGEKTVKLAYNTWSSELITRNDLSKIQAKITSDIELKTQRIAVLEGELTGKTSEELDALRLEKINLELQLSDISGTSKNKIIDDLRKYIGKVESPKSKTNAQYLLSELGNKFLDENKKRILSVMQESISSIPSPVGVPVSYKDITGQVDFVLDRNGKVLGYATKGEVVPLDYTEGLNDVQKAIVNRIAISLDENGMMMPIGDYKRKEGGVFITPQESKLIEDIMNSAASAEKYFANNEDFLKAGTAAINHALAQKFINPTATNTELQKIINDYSDDNIKSEATRLMALAKFEESPGENAPYALQQLRQALILNPQNTKASENINNIIVKYSNELVKLGMKEPEKLIAGVLSKLGEGSSNTYERNLRDLFHPIRSYYYQIAGTEDLIQSQQAGLDETNRILLGNNGIRVIAKNGYDIQGFITSSSLDKFTTVSRLNGLDSNIPIDRLKQYASEAGYDFSSTNFESENKFISESEKFFKIIEEREGKRIADLYYNDFTKAMHILGSIEYSVRNDPASYIMATNSMELEGIKYVGKQDIATAFTRNRILGEDLIIERTWGDTAISVGDFATITFASMGVGAMSGKAIVAGAKVFPWIGGVGKGAEIVLSPGQALATATLEQNAGFLTRMAVALPFDVVGQTGIVIGSQAIGGPVAGAVADVLTMINPVAGAEKRAIAGLGILRSGGEEIIEQRVSKEALKDIEKAGIPSIAEGVFGGTSASGRKIVYHAQEELPKVLQEERFTRVAKEEAEQRLQQIIKESSENKVKQGIETVSEKTFEKQDFVSSENIGKATGISSSASAAEEIGLGAAVESTATFAGAKELTTDEVLNLYRAQGTLNDLVDKGVPGIVAKEEGVFKEVYLIDKNLLSQSDLASLPEDIRKFVSESEGPVAFKYLRAEPIGTTLDYTLEKRAMDVLEEIKTQQAINDELVSRGLDKFFPDRTFAMGISFETIDGKPVLRGLIVERAIAEESYNSIQSGLRQFFESGETSARTLQLMQKINWDLKAYRQKLVNVFNKEGVMFIDTNNNNFAFGFKDRMTGRILTKEEVILGDYDIQYGIEVYAKAYEGGESSLTGKVGYLGPFPKVSVKDDWVVGRSIGGRDSSSFLAGTSITLSNRSYINIENLREGNEVIAFDILNNKIVSANVTAIFIRKVYGYKIIKYDNSELKVTSEHPFFVDGEWVKVKDLKIGDELLTADGKKAKIISIKDVNESVLVYNINVNGFNDYFANDILVHNKPMAYNPEALIDSSRIDYTIKRIDSEKTRVAYASTEIINDNVNQIFSNEFASGQRGAKALVYIDADGQYNTRFWSTGEGNIGNEIHHRDALANLIDEEADGLLERSLSGEIKANEPLLDLAEERMNLAKILSDNRRQISYSSDLLVNSEGFQLILGINGKVKYLDIDSSITAARISRGDSISASKLSEMITEIHNSISSELRGYNKVRVRGLSKLKIDGKVNLPDGLRLVELLE